MFRRLVTLIAVLVILLASIQALADDELDSVVVEDDGGPPFLADEPLRVVTSTVVFYFPQGTRLVLPMTWEKLDTEVRRLQTAETRLKAENDSLKRSASESGVGWGTIALLVSSVLAGMAIQHYIFDR